MATPWRLFWLLVLGWHVVAASAWWWLMPGGFPLSHPRFWANRAVPVAVLAVVATAVSAARRSRFDLLRRTLIIFPAAWGAGAIAARVAFPVTFCWLFLAPLLGAALLGAAAALAVRRREPEPRRPMLAVAAVAALIGAMFAFTQRAPAPDTRPLNTSMPELVVAGPGPAAKVLAGLSDPRLRVHPGDGSLTVRVGSLTLSVQPVLRFLSRSPDGCWTILAPARMRDGPELVLGPARWEGDWLAFSYRADYEATLRVERAPEGGPIRLESYARLDRIVFSHLNSFCDLVISGHQRLSVVFSPCPESLIEVRPAGYPAGRPLRLAYLDAHAGFHVVEATSGEKGPFRELARGRLDRSEPLAITLHDRGVPQLRIVLEDWPAQAGTIPSPTAGWGVPVNAIEFILEGERPGSPANLFITLAGTSVGRGWDSVGHRAGVYRNRMRIEPLATPQSSR